MLKKKIKINFIRLGMIMLILIVSGFGLKNLIFKDDFQAPELKADIPQSDFMESVFAFREEITIDKVSKVTLISNGDIMFHGTQITNAYDSAKKSYDFDNSFKYVKKYLQAADIASGNFETTTAGGAPQGYPVFNAPDEVLDSIKNAGYDVLTTANNHTLDKGKNGILRTLEQIKNRGLISTGTFSEPEGDITTVEKNGIKLGFLGYSYGFNGMESLLSASELDYMVNTVDEEKIKRDIEKAKNQNCDFIILMIHWGSEYSRDPSEDQKALAKKIFEWGGDVILGSHPHVIQKSEITEVDGEKKFVVYSQGNFLSNQRRETLPSIANRNYTEDGVMVNISFEKDLLTNRSRISGVSYTPTWVNRYTSGGKLKYEILPAKEAAGDSSINQETVEKLKASYSQTISKMKYYNSAIE
ncbi:MAG: CapA family protein [Eubacteriaceae bacterium]|nr:CapA family protein [Eubacteriaceae bacterium]